MTDYCQNISSLYPAQSEMWKHNSLNPEYLLHTENSLALRWKQCTVTLIQINDGY